MRADLLHVVTAVSNPIRWASRTALARAAIGEWIADGANVTLVECAYGDRDYELADIPGVNHIPVRARTVVWGKECLLNIGVSRLPHDARYIAALDADIHFRKRSWAAETVHALQLYPVVQPWVDAYDLGPNDEHLQAHKSFCSLHQAGKPVVPTGPRFWKFAGGPYDYSHTGYGWAYTRAFLDEVGGLIEIAGMGSADHHMAYALVGEVDSSMPSAEVSSAYADALRRWQMRAIQAANYKLGSVPQTIEHAFHGRKEARGYQSRWSMFLEHGFDPETDLKRNSYGVLEFAGNKPDLERTFEQYLRSRDEDVGSA
jgi:hypothetical protein